MKHLYLFLGALLLSLSATATTVKRSYGSIEELTQNYFILAYDDNGTEKSHFWEPTNSSYSGAPQNAQWSDVSTLVSNSAAYFVMKAEPITVDGSTHYALNVYNMAGTALNVNGGQALQPYTYGYFAGANDPTYKYSTQWDGDYNALWDIEGSNGKFAFKSVGKNFNGKYLSKENEKADEAVYWTCYYKDAFTVNTEAAKFTSVDELISNFFTIELNGNAIVQNPTSSANHNSESKTVAEAISSYPNHLFKAELVKDNEYKIGVYDIAGNIVTTGVGSYLNLQPNGGILFYGTCAAKTGSWPYNGDYGTDGDSLALWTITAKDGGFVIKNVGVAKYLTVAGCSDDEVVLTCNNRFSNLTYTRTVDNNDYVTLCLPYAATVTGATVYTLTGVDSKTNPTAAYIEEVADNKTEAGKAYILKTTDTSISATLDATSTAASAVTGNALVGTFVSTTATADTYVLNETWHKVVSGSEPTIGANRAWLNLNNASETQATAKSRVLDFNSGNVTAINGVQNTNKNDDAVYNLAGQRVMNPTKGIYIKNGKKYIRK